MSFTLASVSTDVLLNTFFGKESSLVIGEDTDESVLGRPDRQDSYCRAHYPIEKT